MIESRFGRTLIILVFFALLAVSAATGFPRSHFTEPMFRGLRALDWIVETFGTNPFGRIGGAAAFSVAGLVCAWLSYRQQPIGAPNDTRREMDSTGESHNEASLAPARNARRGFGRKPVAPMVTRPGIPQPPVVAPEIEMPFGRDGDVAPRPGWALVLRSPYESWEGARSWLGGRPMVPSNFDWPRDLDGSPLTFLAQIDLGSICAEPSTGQRPVGLPARGAFLVFVGRTYACRVLPDSDMADAAPLPLPADLPDIGKHGFFGNGQTLGYWPVSALAFFDKGREGRPEGYPSSFGRVEDWIVNWGIAAVEAEIAIECLNVELNLARRFNETPAPVATDGQSSRANRVYASKSVHYAQILEDAPDLLAALTAWHRHALASPAEQAVDREWLAAVFERRAAFVDRMTDSYRPKLILPGNPREVWRKVTSGRKDGDSQSFFQKLPPAWRPFVEACVTDWRGHRLLGVEPPFPNNGEDLRGHSCLISVAADPLLGTCSEHEYGMSVWCPTGDMLHGRFDRGQFVRHCAV